MLEVLNQKMICSHPGIFHSGSENGLTSWPCSSIVVGRGSCSKRELQSVLSCLICSRSVHRFGIRQREPR